MSADPRPNLSEVAVEEMPENALRILDSAVRLFARKGFAATSVREIVQEADVTNPMLYYYFDSKEGLFSFLIDLMHRELERELTELI
jgi:AcrR family transcriptional regulator